MIDDAIDPRAILAKLEKVRVEILQRLNGLSQEEFDWRHGE